MSYVNYETKEVNCKVIYFGPAGAGKSENLRSIFKSTSQDLKSGLLELTATGSSTPFFDFLPVSLGYFNEHHVKLHLYTYSLNSMYETLPHVLFQGVDGIVFVADSRIESMADNIEAMYAVKNILADEGYNFSDLPRVLQYNKRDQKGIVPVDIMRQELNPATTIDYEAIATQSKGTLETLQALAHMLIHKLIGN